jgi:hypothetical protein
MLGDDFWDQSDDGRFGVDITTRNDGHFSFTVWKWHDPFPENPHIEPGWAVAEEGGVYADRTATERAARAALRQMSTIPPTPYLPSR